MSEMNKLLVDLSSRVALLENELRTVREENLNLKKKIVLRREVPHIPKYFHHGEDCTIDVDTTFWASSPSNEITIGSNCTIRRGAEWIGPISVGDRTIFNKSSYVRSNVTVGSRVNVGPFVKFVTDTHEIGSPYRRAGKGKFPPITVGDGVWIGANVTILGGVNIGHGAIIAAGALVNSNIPENTIAGGVPAKVLRHIEDA